MRVEIARLDLQCVHVSFSLNFIVIFDKSRLRLLCGLMELRARQRNIIQYDREESRGKVRLALG